MDIDKLKDNWNQLGSKDPLWAILTNPARKDCKWDMDTFFETGEKWVASYFDILAERRLAPAHHERALDFGCGAGRLTRALGNRFDRVDGVDIAETMIGLAREHNAAYPPLHFHLNEAADLSLFDSDTFDFVLCSVVLQHMNNDLKAGYIREFLRVLRSGGLAMFTIPSIPKNTLRGVIRRLPNGVQNLYRRRVYGMDAVMEFHPFKRAKVETLLRSTGAEILAVLPEQTAGPDFRSYLYIVRKPEPGRAGAELSA